MNLALGHQSRVSFWLECWFLVVNVCGGLDKRMSSLCPGTMGLQNLKILVPKNMYAKMQTI